MRWFPQVGECNARVSGFRISSRSFSIGARNLSTRRAVKCQNSLPQLLGILLLHANATREGLNWIGMVVGSRTGQRHMRG